MKLQKRTPDSITCPVCGKTSHHPKDIQFGWCAFCNEYTGNPDWMQLKRELGDMVQTDAGRPTLSPAMRAVQKIKSYFQPRGTGRGGSDQLEGTENGTES